MKIAQEVYLYPYVYKCYMYVYIHTYTFVRCCYCLVAKSFPTVLQPLGLQPIRLLCPWDFPGKNKGAGCNLPLQGIFPTQGSPALQVDSFTTKPPGKPIHLFSTCQKFYEQAHTRQLLDTICLRFYQTGFLFSYIQFFTI